MPEVLDRLIRTGELAAAMDARAFGAAGDNLAHHIGVQRAGHFFGNAIRFGVGRSLLLR